MSLGGLELFPVTQLPRCSARVAHVLQDLQQGPEEGEEQGHHPGIARGLRDGDPVMALTPGSPARSYNHVQSICYHSLMPKHPKSEKCVGRQRSSNTPLRSPFVHRFGRGAPESVVCHPAWPPWPRKKRTSRTHGSSPLPGFQRGPS